MGSIDNSIANRQAQVTLIPIAPPHPVWPRYKRSNTKQNQSDHPKHLTNQSPDLTQDKHNEEAVTPRCHDDEVEEDDSDEIEEDFDEEILPMEQRLMTKLLKSYEKSVRPVKNASDSLVVRMGITLTQIFQMVCMFILCSIDLNYSPSPFQNCVLK